MKFFSPSTQGFYDASVHGPRTVSAPDPAWTAPEDEPDAIAPTIEVRNQASFIPLDAVEVEDALYVELMAGQELGQSIVVGDGGRPVLLQPSVTAIRARVWEAIMAERDRRTQRGGYLVAGYWFHSDWFSRIQQLGLLQLGASIPAGLQWKTMSGEFVLMTPALAEQVFAAAAASDIAIFAAAEAHKAAMEAIADPATYDFTGGWPVVFGEGA